MASNLVMGLSSETRFGFGQTAWALGVCGKHFLSRNAAVGGEAEWL